MKIILVFALTTLLVVSSCKENASEKISVTDMKVANEDAVAAGKLPVLKFDKTEHDFGQLKEGDKVTTEFFLTNIGEADLVIVSAVGSCGCTVPDPPKEPIKPGDSAPIKVSFDSNGKPGQQEKTVTITTNTAAGKETCKIKANVTPNPNRANTALTPSH